MLQYSNDGGYTWSNEKWKPLGKVGEHKKSIYWDRLGQSRDRVYKVVISDPVKVVLVDALIEVEKGTN